MSTGFKSDSERLDECERHIAVVLEMTKLVVKEFERIEQEFHETMQGVTKMCEIVKGLTGLHEMLKKQVEENSKAPDDF